MRSEAAQLAVLGPVVRVLEKLECSLHQDDSEPTAQGLAGTAWVEVRSEYERFARRLRAALDRAWRSSPNHEAALELLDLGDEAMASLGSLLEAPGKNDSSSPFVLHSVLTALSRTLDAADLKSIVRRLQRDGLAKTAEPTMSYDEIVERFGLTKPEITGLVNRREVDFVRNGRDVKVLIWSMIDWDHRA